MEKEKEKIVKNIKESGINLQLEILTTLRKKDWKCELDKLYTDDEEGITREIDLVAEKKFFTPIELPQEYFSKNKLDKIFLSPEFSKIITEITLAIECKYIKEKNGWIFFAGIKEKSNKGLNWVLKKFSYPIFVKDSRFSMASLLHMTELENFREKENIIVAETGQDIEKAQKTDIRDALMKVIKYLTFRFREKEGFRIVVYDTPIKNSWLNKILLKLSPKLLARMVLRRTKEFTFLNLNIYYPLILVNDGLKFYDHIENNLEDLSHAIIKQNYLSKSFLKADEVKKIGQEGITDEIHFFVEFIKKDNFVEFLDKIEIEAKSITDAVKKTFLYHFDRLMTFEKRRMKLGEKKAFALAELDGIIEFRKNK